MKIIQIAPELTPIAKVGGLADFIQGLSSALIEENQEVHIILPFYSQIDRKKLSSLKVIYENFPTDSKNSSFTNSIWSARMGKLSLLLIAPSHPPYFTRSAIYGESDDIERFSYFCKIALEYLLTIQDLPDILHFHDWITGVGAPICRKLARFSPLQKCTIFTTLHNLCYQGVCSINKLRLVDLHNIATALKDHKNAHKANLLKGAILYSDHITTVSPSYSKEIKKDCAFGLEPLLRKNEEKITGILNGIDTEYWDPVSDPHLAALYPKNKQDIEALLEAKKQNRIALAKKADLLPSDRPLLGCVTRLVKQKGPKLIQLGIETALSQGGQSILLGSATEKDIQNSFYELAKVHKQGGQAAFFFRFDEALAHLIFAAADMILIPSLFEPCGLTQLIALRYGAIPIVHHVGGLKDTIVDIEESDSPIEKRNGYTFAKPSAENIISTIHRAFFDFQYHRDKWIKMIERAISQDWSWKRSAISYLELYHRFVK